VEDEQLSRHVGARVREIRERRLLTVGAVARRAGLSPSEISKIEANAADEDGKARRRVSVAHLFALAYALHVSPLDLLLPLEDQDLVEVVDGVEVEAHWVRSWVAGYGPLPGDDAYESLYFAESPGHVQRRHATFNHPAIARLQTLRMFAETAIVRDFSGVEPGLLASTLRDNADMVVGHIEALARETERGQHDGQG
jgi:transcriptional regulator with XRE-family HTH domain